MTQLPGFRSQPSLLQVLQPVSPDSSHGPCNKLHRKGLSKTVKSNPSTECDIKSFASPLIKVANFTISHLQDQDPGRGNHVSLQPSGCPPLLASFIVACLMTVTSDVGKENVWHNTKSPSRTNAGQMRNIQTECTSRIITVFSKLRNDSSIAYHSY